jgi:hypothetical protein
MRDASGQTVAEVLMLLGVLTAVIVVVTEIVAPVIIWMVMSLVISRALMISSV